jgi:hypothetical protein
MRGLLQKPALFKVSKKRFFFKKKKQKTFVLFRWAGRAAASTSGRGVCTHGVAKARDENKSFLLIFSKKKRLLPFLKAPARPPR